MKKSFITFVGLVALAPVWAQDGTVLEASAGARMAYQERQALAEVPRLVQQFEVLANNQDQIAARLVKVESGSGDSAELRAEIEKLRAEAALQAAEASAKAAREQAEYTKRNASRPAAPTPRASGGAASAKPAAPAYSGPYYEHVVEPGQTLSFIAKGFETTVPRILAANPGLKANALRVGQKLIIPAEDTSQKK